MKLKASPAYTLALTHNWYYYLLISSREASARDVCEAADIVCMNCWLQPDIRYCKGTDDGKSWMDIRVYLLDLSAGQNARRQEVSKNYSTPKVLE